MPSEVEDLIQVWFIERRKRIKMEASIRGLDQMRRYRDELRRYVTGESVPPQFQRLLAQVASEAPRADDACNEMLSRAVRDVTR